MDIYLLRVFQSQVALQCRFMLWAADDVDKALKQKDVRLVFYALQNFLNAAANVSKALWGVQGGKFAEQRKPLRDSIGIADDSPLRQVAMRNNFEHFDERLDLWWKESKRHNYVDLNTASVTGIEDIDSFRNFDPKTTDLSFWGQRFSLRELIGEVRRILPTLEAEASKPHWQTN